MAQCPYTMFIKANDWPRQHSWSMLLTSQWTRTCPLGSWTECTQGLSVRIQLDQTYHSYPQGHMFFSMHWIRSVRKIWSRIFIFFRLSFLGCCPNSFFCLIKVFVVIDKVSQKSFFLFFSLFLVGKSFLFDSHVTRPVRWSMHSTPNQRVLNLNPSGSKGE